MIIIEYSKHFHKYNLPDLPTMAPQYNIYIDHSNCSALLRCQCLKVNI